jgi:hypothetical protein
VLNGSAEGELRNAKLAELLREHRAGVPRNVVAPLLEADGNTGHRIEVAINGLAGEKDIHCPSPHVRYALPCFGFPSKPLARDAPGCLERIPEL